MATIRSAVASDRSALFELVRAFSTPTPPDSEQFSKALEAKLPDPSSCLLVAELERRLLGYVSGYCHATFYAGGVTAWVDELLVLEPFRGTGVGRQLMDAFEEWANERKACSCRSLPGALPHSTNIEATHRTPGTTRSTLRLAGDTPRRNQGKP